LEIDSLKSLYDNVIRYEIQLWTAIDTALHGECGLQLTWFEILRFLASHGDCRVQDMAAEFGITVGGTSKVVDRIEAAGYCKRRANPSDRRSSLIALTPEGRGVLEHATTVFERELQLRIGSVIDKQAVRTLNATLTTLRTHGHTLTRDSTGKARSSSTFR
jgi:DNA-binding MarR family transcriptional regulator